MSEILTHIENGLATITLNRPQKYNALTRTMAFEMQEALENYRHNDTVRCVLITGAGTAFCAGQDLAEITDPGHPGMNHILSEQFNPIVRQIERMPKPVVAAVNGVAAGAGANFALNCDIVVAKRSAVFLQAFSKIGLAPDCGGSFWLPRLVGWQKASALMLLGDKVSAEEAERMGMIYKWFEDDAFDAEVKKITDRLAQGPTRAYAYTKQLLQWSSSHLLKEQLENEDKIQQRAAATEDFAEGVAAFLAKRNPDFKGR